MRASPPLLFAVAATAWGLSWPLTKYFTTRLSPLDVSALEMLGSYMLLSVISVCRPASRLAHADRNFSLRAGLLEPGLATLLFVAGVAYTTATVGAVLNSLQSILTAALGVVFLRETVSPKLWLLLGVAAVGADLTVLHAPPAQLAANATSLGVLSIGGGLFTAAMYLVWLKKAAPAGDALTITKLQNGSAACLVIALDLAAHVALHQPFTAMAAPELVLATLAAGVLANGLPFYCYTVALRSANVGGGALYLSLIPLVAGLVSVVAFGEVLSNLELCGMALTVGAVTVAALGDLRSS